MYTWNWKESREEGRLPLFFLFFSIPALKKKKNLPLFIKFSVFCLFDLPMNLVYEFHHVGMNALSQHLLLSHLKIKGSIDAKVCLKVCDVCLDFVRVDLLAHLILNYRITRRFSLIWHIIMQLGFEHEYLRGQLSWLHWFNIHYVLSVYI